jgi:predicted RNA-binding Zn-ribbon protein involved in translation (DUF1610 family)
MTSIMIRCPNTGRAVSTAIETEKAVFQKLPTVASSMHCPACGEDHVWSIGSAWLLGEPRELRLVPKAKVEAA